MKYTNIKNTVISCLKEFFVEICSAKVRIVAISVLSVLWMTSYFPHIMERMGHNDRPRVCLVQFTMWQHHERSLPSNCILFTV